MPSVFIPKPPFPNVPQLPGVPQLVRSAIVQAQAILDTGLLIANIVKFAASQPPVWGVFNQNNEKVLFPDNIYAFNDRAEWRLSDYPVQKGAFASFNKVTVPFEDVVIMTKGGSLSDRKAFLDSVDRIAGDTNLYNILTPEKTYASVNVLRRELSRRSSEGAFYLIVELYFRNIQEQNPQYSTTAANTANANNPPALPPVNQGNVQPQSAVPSSASTQATNAIASAPL